MNVCRIYINANLLCYGDVDCCVDKCNSNVLRFYCFGQNRGVDPAIVSETVKTQNITVTFVQDH